ncbi:DUF2255 family protein [Microbacterium sp. dk485]|uniref:DUF2255 family protein n=1 Tax=Microbacterium sp. dk485 TaxID=2560021 RepID=UPI001073108C|nr:DUF2255 family protein [Microbacterium sp. dk485]TFV84489.1 DUF2255 family protein [Microbacterium sp. dk485]
MAFDDVVRVLDETRVVAVITRRADGTRVATPIWAMVVDGVPYLRSAYGPSSWWYRHVLAGRDVEFALGDGRIAERDRQAALELPSEAVAVESVPEDDPIQRDIDRVLDAKYAAEPDSIAAMKSPEAMGCTLRVVAP